MRQPWLWVTILFVLYITSGPPLEAWYRTRTLYINGVHITGHQGRGLPGGNRTPPWAKVLYAPVYWVTERSPILEDVYVDCMLWCMTQIYKHQRYQAERRKPAV